MLEHALLRRDTGRKSMTDFFISYTHADKGWAEWISFVLEEEGFSVIVQAWDFRPGSNFVLEMQKAASKASRTIMVLSPDYLQSQFASPEWASAFGQDPQGVNRKLVPVQVRPCEPPGLLSAIVQIRVAGLEEAAARRALLDGIGEGRAKPTSRPAFPGAAAAPQPHKAFPGPDSAPKPARPSSPLIPPLRGAATDMDKRRFARSGFETIRTVFQSNLSAVSQQEPRIESDFQERSATDFRAELFLDGKSICACRVWLGGMHSDNNICYSEGRTTSNNSCNEIIALSQGDELRFTALMAMGSYAHELTFDLKRLSAEDAARYLWERFVAYLSG